MTSRVLVAVATSTLAALVIAAMLRSLFSMPINKLDEPTKPYQPRYNSTPTKERYGLLVTLGPPVRVLRGSCWVPAVPVRDEMGNTFYALKCHLSRGLSSGRGVRFKPVGFSHGVAHLFSSRAMAIAWLKRHREIVRRCCNPACNNYRNYGAKGVKLYEPWKEPAAFFAYITQIPGWDDPSLQVDRKDNSKGYEPGNIKFSTRTDNVRNRSNTVRVTVDGASYALAAVASARWPWYPVSYVGLHWRQGKTLEQIGEIAVKYRNRRKTTWS